MSYRTGIARPVRALTATPDAPYNAYATYTARPSRPAPVRSEWATMQDLAREEARAARLARVDELAATLPPVGDWAEGLDLTPAPARPRRSVTYRRVQAAVQGLATLLLASTLLLAGAAVQAHQWGAVIGAALALSLAAGAVMVGGRK